MAREDEENVWSTAQEGSQVAGLQTPTLSQGFDDSTLETPRQPRGEQQQKQPHTHTHPVLSMAALSMTESPRRSSIDADSPRTARPEISSRKSSLATVTSKSPDLYEMASMYQPDEPTSLVVADAMGGYFQNVNLSTPTVERFNAFAGHSHHFNGFNHTDSSNGTAWHQSSQAVHEPEAARSHSDRHRRTASEASMASAGSAEAVTAARRASWYAPSTSAVGRHISQEQQPGNTDNAYNPRHSTSSSSIAESAGTAGDATDSEYEDQRSRSHSRQGSRRPSTANLPSLAGKRLSSFAPIADISRNNSQTDLNVTDTHDNPSRGPSTSTSPQTSPPPLKNGLPRRQSTLSPDMNTGISSSMVASTSAQSAASSASSATSSDNGHAAQHTNGKQMEIVGIGNKPENGPPPGKRRKQKPSPMDKVMSKTRPRDLPPKAREEDKRHLKEYEEMLTMSKAAEKRRQAVLAAKIQEKEQLADQALSTWEKQILPNWKAVLRDDKLRKVWWSGTMPPRHRARFWQGCIGNGLALSKASFNRAMALVKAHQAAGRFPNELVAPVEDDMRHTLTHTKLFQEGQPLHQDLRDLIYAHAVFWKDKPIYAPGTAYLAAMLLVSMPVQEAFLCLVNIVNKSLLKTFYAGPQDDIEAYYRVFNTLLADKMPKIYRNFVAHNIRPALYLKPWLTCLFTHFLGFDTITRIWDVFVLEGDQFLYRTALALLQILEARLFNPDHEELAELFRGEDRGGKAIVAREHVKADDQVEPWEVYECLGATEEALFKVIEEMEWKEATFQRLLTRELPDPDA